MSNVATTTTARLVEKIEMTIRIAEFYDTAVENAHYAGLDTISEEMSERSAEWHEESDDLLRSLARMLSVTESEALGYFLAAAYGIGK
jgi:hypothetical protein